MDEIATTGPRLLRVIIGKPTDADIRERIEHFHGVTTLVAQSLGMQSEELTARIAKSSDLAYSLQCQAAKADGHATVAIRAGCCEHNPVWVAMRLREREKEFERRGSGGTGGDQPIDFTREIESAADCTDAELQAIIMRDAKPAPGERCPCCGHVEAAEPETAEIVP